jgi:alpha-L-fucosidase
MSTQAKPEAIEAWRDMRFGMFIHWGPVSLKGTEIGWSRGTQIPIEEYDNLYKQFNPVRFSAGEWVNVAKEAGMKYMVFTTKHHDGFCMWDTKQTDYNIMQSPFHRDVVAELAAACKKESTAFGTYYSTCDWHHPNFPGGGAKGDVPNPDADIERYTEYMKAQTTELIKDYGPLSTLWFDMPQHFDERRGQSIIDLLRRLQPDILFNNRSGAPGDYDTPEQKIGGFNMMRPWETCMTICRQWAWKPDDEMKSLKQCIQTLVQTAGGDGNLLFNVGPMPTGEIEPRQVERLKEMGGWLARYGVSIYGTRGGPFQPGEYGVSTRKGNTIYLHLMNWKEDSLTLPAVPFRIINSTVLTGGEVKVKQNSNRTNLSLSSTGSDNLDTIVALEMDGPAIEIEPLQ